MSRPVRRAIRTIKRIAASPEKPRKKIVSEEGKDSESPQRRGGRPRAKLSPKLNCNPGRPARIANPFLGGKRISGAARKAFLDNDYDSLVFERTAFELGRERRSRLEWSQKEISHLKKGVKKHGEGFWSAIRQDSELHFHPQRTQVDLKDKWRNLTSYVRYCEHPMRQFILVNSNHTEIVTSAGNLHIFNNRWPRDAALKVSTRDEFYPVDEDGNRPDSIMIHLKEAMEEREKALRPQIVHVYLGTRTLSKPKSSVLKFKNYEAIYTGTVQKVFEEVLVKPGDILSPEEESARLAAIRRGDSEEEGEELP